MYSDHKKRPAGAIAAGILALLLVLGLLTGLLSGSRRDLGEESAAAIRETIWSAALQCYVVEGVYPPNLRYLEDNYGIQVNTRDFYVSYEAFASNLPPTVIVKSK